MDSILKKFFDIYWQGGSGWKDKYEVSPEDFLLLKEAGLMFDLPKSSPTHDEVMEKLDFLTCTISAQDVANAFLYSLSSRQLQ